MKAQNFLFKEALNQGILSRDARKEESNAKP